jgi:hypothetical protein
MVDVLAEICEGLSEADLVEDLKPRHAAQTT